MAPIRPRVISYSIYEPPGPAGHHQLKRCIDEVRLFAYYSLAAVASAAVAVSATSSQVSAGRQASRQGESPGSSGGQRHRHRRRLSWPAICMRWRLRSLVDADRRRTVDTLGLRGTPSGISLQRQKRTTDRRGNIVEFHGGIPTGTRSRVIVTCHRVKYLGLVDDVTQTKPSNNERELFVERP